MGDELRDDADKRRADVYSSARIGAAAALTIVLVVLLVLDVAVPDYDISPGILLPHRQPPDRRDPGAQLRLPVRPRAPLGAGLAP